MKQSGYVADELGAEKSSEDKDQEVNGEIGLCYICQIFLSNLLLL